MPCSWPELQKALRIISSWHLESTFYHLQWILAYYESALDLYQITKLYLYLVVATNFRHFLSFTYWNTFFTYFQEFHSLLNYWLSISLLDPLMVIHSFYWIIDFSKQILFIHLNIQHWHLMKFFQATSSFRCLFMGHLVFLSYFYEQVYSYYY